MSVHVYRQREKMNVSGSLLLLLCVCNAWCSWNSFFTCQFFGPMFRIKAHRHYHQELVMRNMSHICCAAKDHLDGDSRIFFYSHAAMSSILDDVDGQKSSIINVFEVTYHQSQLRWKMRDKTVVSASHPLHWWQTSVIESFLYLSILFEPSLDFIAAVT